MPDPEYQAYKRLQPRAEAAQRKLNRGRVERLPQMEGKPTAYLIPTKQASVGKRQKGETIQQYTQRIKKTRGGAVSA